MIRSASQIIAGLAVLLSVAYSTALATEKAPARLAAAPAAKIQVVNLEVTRDGFVPEKTRVKVGQPVKLVVTRKVDRTCATEIVIKDYQISQPLPLNAPVEVTLTPKKPGAIRFACAMDMIAGTLVAE